MSVSRPTVVIVDYGMGNLFSIQRAVAYVGGMPVISGEPPIIRGAERLILPGVGAFGDGMDNLRQRELIEPIKDFVSSGKTLLGICLGMQLLMTESEEFGLHSGLDLIRGRVTRLPEPRPEGPFYKIPHVGWNRLNFPSILKDTKTHNPWEDTIFNKLQEGIFVYFVHSYIVVPDSPLAILSETDYGNSPFCSALCQDNLLGCQFHPEVSGEAGLEILSEFVFNFSI